jgi:hypothetical protein
VRAAVAAHRNAPVATVERLVYDSVAAVRAKARSNRAPAPRRQGPPHGASPRSTCCAFTSKGESPRGAPRAEAFRARIAACDPDGATLPAALRKRLAEALTANPSPDAWRALCDALEGARWTDDLLAAALAWLAPSLAAWPDALRVTDPRWMQRLDKGLDDPRLALARTGVATGTRWSERFALHLAACPWIAAWTALDLHDLPLGPVGASVLFASPWLGPLRDLNLSGTALGDAGTLRLVACPALSGLTSLRLGGCGLGVEGFQALGDAPLCPDAPTPRPRGQRQGLAAHRDALDAHPPPGRASLRSRRCGSPTTTSATRASRRCSRRPQCATLRTLDLQANGLSDATVRLLASSPHLTQLRELVLVANFLSAEGLRALAASPYLGALRALDVSCTFARDEAEAVGAALAPLVARGCAVTADVLAL